MEQKQSSANFLAASNPNKNVRWHQEGEVSGGQKVRERVMREGNTEKRRRQESTKSGLACQRFGANLYFCVINCKSKYKPNKHKGKKKDQGKEKQKPKSKTEKLNKGNFIYEKQRQAAKCDLSRCCFINKLGDLLFL